MVDPQKAASSALLPAGLAPLTGMRACANAAVVLVHAWVLWKSLLDYETLRELGNNHFLPWLAAQGALGADIFMVLSALLAAYHLLPALEGCSGDGNMPAATSPASQRSERSVVLGYWRKRAARILPAYISANLLALVVFRPGRSLPQLARTARHLAYPDCPAGMRWNALFLTNAVAYHQTCGAHLWSTVITVHLYLGIPLLLCALRPRQPGFRRRLPAALAAAVVAGMVWRYWSASRTNFFLPIGDQNIPAEDANVYAVLQSIYLPTASRIAQLAGGAALGLLLRTPATVSWLKRRSLLVSATAFALQSLFVAMTSFGNLHPAPDAPHLPKPAADAVLALMFYGSPFHTLLISATILALLLRTDPLHALVARILASPVFETPARLSYGVYLLHEMVKFGLALAAPQLLPWAVARAPVAALAGFFGVLLASSFAAAWLQWRLVERPFYNKAAA